MTAWPFIISYRVTLMNIVNGTVKVINAMMIRSIPTLIFYTVYCTVDERRVITRSDDASLV